MRLDKKKRQEIEKKKLQRMQFKCLSFVDILWTRILMEREEMDNA